jgi:pyruvate dehydrogenase E2 component (dihydrolipoamide acetyltransferase)
VTVEAKASGTLEIVAASTRVDSAVRISPIARRYAAGRGIRLGSVRATGPGGRIMKADVLAAADGAGAELVEPTRLEAVIARRMAEAKSTVPHFQVETEVQMDAAIALRAGLKELAGGEPTVSLNDLVVRATALALREHPKANGSYRDGAFELHSRVNVGIAVAAENALVVPTIFDADRLSLGEIGRESRRLAERVRSGSVTPPELAGGTFTVSDLGMFGITALNPVINPPQAAILGIGRTRPTLVRGADGGVEDASLMTLTLSCDHRILYGAEAARFLAQIRVTLESPMLLAI